MKTLSIFTIIFLMICSSMYSQHQAIPKNKLEEAPIFFKKQFIEPTFNASHIHKTKGHYTEDDWADVIDATWGGGLPVSEKLQIFDEFWQTIDWRFACFQDLEVDWDSLRVVYRNEILDTVSRGRFAAIMNHLSLALKEAHTTCEDMIVCITTPLNPGIPLLQVGSWGEARHFGAGLTPIQDSTLLVYRSIEDHPLGLVPGDIVLGYDGYLWKDLYKELLAAQLPIKGFWWGCSASAFGHSWLMAGGMNWHLFDTIDILRYETGDTLHFATSLLDNLNESIFVSEQIEVPGVPMPDYYEQELFTHGIIDGTNIGYIYGWGWFWEAEQEFYDAVHALMFEYETTGMIIDFRMNYGGNMFLSNNALSLLFNETVETIGFAVRSDTADHFAMSNGSTNSYKIQGDPETFYDHPIAVLTGPGAVSSGDQVALRFKFHPNAKFFGKSTTAAFNAPADINLDNNEWFSRYARHDAFLAAEPQVYLTHDELEVDVEVWHNPDDAAAGIDAVVQAAIDWIDSLTVDIPSHEINSLSGNLVVFPNPVFHHAKIHLNLEKEETVSLTIINSIGELMQTVLRDKKLAAGDHYFDLETGDFPGGVYYTRLKLEKGTETKQMVVIK